MQARVLAVGIGAVWLGAFVAPGAAFVPANSVRRASTLMMVEKSKSMPFLERPTKVLIVNRHHSAHDTPQQYTAHHANPVIHLSPSDRTSIPPLMKMGFI